MTKLSHILTIAIALSVSGCTFLNEQASKFDATTQFSQFSNIPIPIGAFLDTNKTNTFGAGNEWLGEIIFAAPYSLGDTFIYLQQEMPKFGWKEDTSIRGENAILIYSNPTRVAIIQLRKISSKKTNVSFTVSLSDSSKHAIQTSVIQPQAQSSYINNSRVTSPVSQTSPQSNRAYTTAQTSTLAPAQSSQVSRPSQASQTANKAMAAELISLSRASQATAPTVVATTPVTVAQTQPLTTSPQTSYQLTAQETVSVQPISSMSGTGINDVYKAPQGSLGLGEASNAFYQSSSAGVGLPITY